jgi:hypothetical protein
MDPMKGNFFTHHLKEKMCWKIHGAEDIVNWKPPQNRLVQCIEGLRNGTMYFVDVGRPLII